MYTLISGSPKPVNSNSLYFLKNISKNIEDFKIFELKKDKYSEIIESIQKSSVIVFALPLYVDSPTSITLSFYDYIIDNNINLDNKKIYAILNCGFREGEQNITAVNIIKNWCKKIGGKYSGSIMIGAGEIVGKKKYKFISHTALKKINCFSNCIRLKQKSGDVITTMNFINNKVYCYLANLSWTKKGKLNNLSKENLIIK